MKGLVEAVGWVEWNGMKINWERLGRGTKLKISLNFSVSVNCKIFRRNYLEKLLSRTSWSFPTYVHSLIYSA